MSQTLKVKNKKSSKTKKKIGADKMALWLRKFATLSEKGNLITSTHHVKKLLAVCNFSLKGSNTLY